MEIIDIAGEIRHDMGKKAAKACKAKGLVPCILYGGEKVLAFAVDNTIFRSFVYTPKVVLLNITLEGNVYKAVMKDVQYHPITDKIIHIDFLEISENKKVNIQIPITVTGVSKGVKEGGKLVKNLRKLKVRGIPSSLPDSLTVDVTELEIGQSLRVATLVYPGLEIINPKETPVITIRSTRAAKEGAEVTKEGAK